MVDGRQVPLNMLAYEVEARKLRVGKADKDVPWGDDNQKKSSAGDEAHGLQGAPFTGDQHPAEDDYTGKHCADETLREDRKRGKGVESQKEHTPLRAVVLPRPEQKRQQGRGQQDRHGHVKNNHAAQGEIEGTRCEDNGRKEAGAAAIELRAGDIHGQTSQEREKRGDEPDRPFGQAEESDRESREPVDERRLLEILDPVQAGGEPVAGCDQLAGDLRIAALVGNRERTAAEHKTEHHGPGNCKDKKVAPGASAAIQALVENSNLACMNWCMME